MTRPRAALPVALAAAGMAGMAGIAGVAGTLMAAGPAAAATAAPPAGCRTQVWTYTTRGHAVAAKVGTARRVRVNGLPLREDGRSTALVFTRDGATTFRVTPIKLGKPADRSSRVTLVRITLASGKVLVVKAGGPVKFTQDGLYQVDSLDVVVATDGKTDVGQRPPKVAKVEVTLREGCY